MTKRIMIVGAGLIGLIIVVIIFAAIFGGGSKGSTDYLLSMAQKQTELIRVSEIGTAKGKTAQSKQLAASVSATMQSQLNTTQSLLTKAGVKVNPKQLATGKNSATDTTLTQAEQSGRFDEVFIQTIKAGLADYQATIKNAYDVSKLPATKESLSAAYTSTGLILAPAVQAQ